ncbi:MAG: hypothetical protein M0R46_17655 [Candidatus Muirbacterium halophilum]|nr:hypothetical protein [Candidatus Muirbacterium halophilum]
MKIKKVNELNVQDMMSYPTKAISDCVTYLEDAMSKVEQGGGNHINLDGLMVIAKHLDSYKIKEKQENDPTEDGIYTLETVQKFKDFVDSMARDEVTNNRWED